ncbi:MAG: hypothetical protein U0223_07525 [Nitrospira sp.]|nr:hypothetical protein [Nitrospira sp.]
MGSEQHEDVYDYTMSDLFVSDTRSRPYQTGFRSHRHLRRPSLAYINALCDLEFAAYIRHGCRLPSTSLPIEAELAQVRAELHALHAELQALRRAVTRPVPYDPVTQGGLNVPPRT